MKQFIKELTPRQKRILDFIARQDAVSNQEITNHLKDASRVTVVRDANILLQKGLIERLGGGRNVKYREKEESKLLRYIDADAYFSQGPDEREGALKHFNFNIFSQMKSVFSAAETQELEELNRDYQERIRKLTADILKKEFERLTIELGWKSSRIEGNTYSLIDTEILIKEHREAAGHKKEEAIMILNHKRALDFVRDKRSEFQKLSIGKISSIHDLIVADLAVERGLRKAPVGIVGTAYRPLDNEHQIREALEKAIAALNALTDPLSKALWSIVMISYIQPFADGNKRTARILGNGVLLAHGCCPLSFRSVDEAEYKKALIFFYERNNIRLFKNLFADQFRFAVRNYFR